MIKTLFTMIALTLVATFSQAEEWTGVSQESSLNFRTTYEGQPVAGSFKAFTTHLQLAQDNGRESTLKVVVDTGSIDFNSDDLKEGAISEEWFFVDRFPQAVFISDLIEATGQSNYRATGKLTIKGIERTVSVPFHLDISRQAPVMTGSVELQRTDFDIGSGIWAGDNTIGLAVTVTFNVPLQPAS